MDKYTQIHLTRQTLVQDLKHLVDEYVRKTATEDDVKQMLAIWRKNCPKLIFKTEDSLELAPRVVTLIGAKRSVVAQSVANTLDK